LDTQVQVERKIVSIHVCILYIYCNNADDRWSDIVDKGRIKAHRKRTRSYIDRSRAASYATILIAYNIRAFNIAQTNSHDYWHRTGRWLYLQTDRIATHSLGLHPVVSNSLKIYTNVFYFFSFSTSTAIQHISMRCIYSDFVCVCVLLCIAEVPADHPQCGPRPDFRLPSVRPKTRIMDSSPHAYESNLHLATTASVVSYRYRTRLLSERKKNNFGEQSKHIIIQTGSTLDRSQTKHQFSYPKFTLEFWGTDVTGDRIALGIGIPTYAFCVIIYWFISHTWCIQNKWFLMDITLSTCC